MRAVRDVRPGEEDNGSVWEHLSHYRRELNPYWCETQFSDKGVKAMGKKRDCGHLAGGHRVFLRPSSLVCASTSCRLFCKWSKGSSSSSRNRMLHLPSLMDSCSSMQTQVLTLYPGTVGLTEKARP